MQEMEIREKGPQDRKHWWKMVRAADPYSCVGIRPQRRRRRNMYYAIYSLNFLESTERKRLNCDTKLC